MGNHESDWASSFFVLEWLLFISFALPFPFQSSFFPILGQLLVEDLICSIKFLAREWWFDAAAGVDGHISIVVPSIKVTGHPVTPFCSGHSPQLALPCKGTHLHSLDFTEINGLFGAEGEVIAHDVDAVSKDGNVLVHVEDVGCH